MNMRGIVPKTPGAADQLVMQEFPVPRPLNDELLVRVKATALNRADILQRQGRYDPPKGTTPILGLEMAGVVEAVGPDCSGWHTGDRVCALLNGGGYAEYVTIPAKMAIPVPEKLSFEEAAAIPEVFLTAYQALFWLGGLRREQRVLVHAGASGVGTAAIQLIKGAGAIPIATARSTKKIDYCLKVGAKVSINASDGKFADDVLEATAGEGVDLILDCIGASYWDQNLTALAQDGKMVMIAMMGGLNVEQLNLGMLLRKRLQIVGTTLRSRDREYKIRLTRDFVKKILPGFLDGTYRPVVDTIFSWEEAAEAHRHMEANLNMGKIILSMERVIVQQGGGA